MMHFGTAFPSLVAIIDRKVYSTCVIKVIEAFPDGVKELHVHEICF